MKRVLALLILILASISQASVAAATTDNGNRQHATAPVPQPVAILANVSSATAGGTAAAQLQAKIQARQQVATLLNALHAETPFFVITLDKKPTLVYHGLSSLMDASSSLQALDGVHHTGPVDLGAALDLVTELPAFAQGGSVAIVSDLFVLSPSGSKATGKSLRQLLEAVHAKGIGHILLLPAGAWDRNATDQPAPYVQVLRPGETPARWAETLAPRHDADDLPPPRPFWRQGPFVFSAVLVLVMVPGALLTYRIRQQQIKADEGRDKYTAAGTMNYTFTDPATEPDNAVVVMRLKTVFRVLVIEDGTEITLAPEPWTIGRDPCANRFLDDALSTLAFSHQAGASGGTIRNVGPKAIYIGKTSVPSGGVLTVTQDDTVECLFTPTVTLAMYTTSMQEKAA